MSTNIISLEAHRNQTKADEENIIDFVERAVDALTEMMLKITPEPPEKTLEDYQAIQSFRKIATDVVC